jgi:hypothetical protein
MNAGANNRARYSTSARGGSLFGRRGVRSLHWVLNTKAERSRCGQVLRVLPFYAFPETELTDAVNAAAFFLTNFCIFSGAHPISVSTSSDIRSIASRAVQTGHCCEVVNQVSGQTAREQLVPPGPDRNVRPSTFEYSLAKKSMLSDCGPVSDRFCGCAAADLPTASRSRATSSTATGEVLPSPNGSLI